MEASVLESLIGTDECERSKTQYVSEVPHNTDRPRYVGQYLLWNGLREPKSRFETMRPAEYLYLMWSYRLFAFLMILAL